jgi:FKBP-type peptidyl-prolyl cis-trans isomerase SlyD
MRIGPGSVVTFDFTLKDGDGIVIDEGAGDEAMIYLHGHEQIFPGLEKALEGKAAGDKLAVTLPPAEAYGERSEQEEVRVPRGELPEDIDLEVGAELEAHGPDGETDTFWVVEVENGWVVLTRDHPLSGVTLCFDVHVTEVRSATSDELQHGHAHAAGRPHDH